MLHVLTALRWASLTIGALPTRLQPDAYSGNLACNPISVIDERWLERDIPDGNTTISAMTYRVKFSWAQNCENLVNMFSCTKGFYESPDVHPSNEKALEYAGRTYIVPCGDSRMTAVLITHFSRITTNVTVGIVCSPYYTHHAELMIITQASTYFGGSREYNRTTLPEGENLLPWVEQSNTQSVDKMGNEFGERFQGWYWSDKTEWINKPDVELGAWCHLISRVGAFSKDDIMNTTQLAAISEKVFARLFPHIAQAGYITNLGTPGSLTVTLT